MIAFRIPLRLKSAANLREHWAVKAKRVLKERTATGIIARRKVPDLAAAPGAFVATLTRVAPRALDDDNLRSAFKAVRDELAKQMGVDDRNPRVRWEYGQEKGKPKEYAVKIEITEAP